ncbi:long-chain fatty acid transport protein 4-like [Uloborus diversus]|uniref:long-chain fatty acid transport protein 4-like n=1 Tax=Uloborus diversus TaxID=327109 RepID=UPI0024095627|nr:long-chain fatty acid transport protein 4-like [Uloborus diversus]
MRAAYLYFRLLVFLRRCHAQNLSLVDLFKRTVQKYGSSVCFVYQDEEWTYNKVDELSNRVANLFLSRGYRKGDEVALFLENCPEYVCIWMGLAKIGVITSFINTNLRQDPLAHTINVIDARAIIFSRNLADAVKDAITFLKRKDTMDYYCFNARSSATSDVMAKNLDTLLEESSTSEEPLRNIKINFEDKLLYIYTSGTTGLPKAAIIRHSRCLWIGGAAQYVAQLKDFETFYNPLPLYHTAGGLVFVSVVLVFGGKMIIRNKFSASNFWKEAAKHGATVSQYIGEMCRYLLNQPHSPEETKHQVRLMFGNGLRPHIWQEFQDRFNIPHIIEIYGATEGNANLVNMFGRVGSVGFISRTFHKLYPVHLIKVNPETGEPIRNEQGLCIRCKPGERYLVYKTVQQKETTA